MAATTLTIPHPYEDRVAEEWIGTHVTNWEAQKRLSLAITTEEDGLVGAVGFALDLPNGRAELGYWIGVPFWNRGYATEAGKAVLEFGFGALGLNRIDAHYFGDNHASGKVMEKLGMKPEGVLRQHIVKWGVAEDVVLYAILASEWGSG